MKKSFKSMLPIICIVGITIVISIGLYHKVMAREEEKCWQTLQDTAESVNREITMKFKDEIVKMHLTADTMLSDEDLERGLVYFMHFETVKSTTVFSRVDVLYPDNALMDENGRRKMYKGTLSFSELAQKGECMSMRMTDPETGRESLYYTIPLVKNNETLAILIGVIECNALKDIFQPDIYGGQANCCMVDCTDGSYIMDSWHDELGNAFGDFSRERMKGYEDADMMADAKAHREGVTAFISKTTGNPIYMYYIPTGIYDWQLCIFAEESVLFENLFYLKKLLLFAGMVEAVLLSIYLLWNLYGIRQLQESKLETEKQLENSNVLIQCVRELSADADMHVSIHNLLRIINNYFSSDRTYIFQTTDKEENLLLTYEYTADGKSPLSQGVREVILEDLTDWMKTNMNPKISRSVGVSDNFMGCVNIEKEDGEKCMVVPLGNKNGINGFIGMDHPRKHYDDTTLLSSISFFITSALKRQKQEDYLRHMSYRDELTSLYNRNKYMQILKIAEGETLFHVGVAYIDLNGLKEINDLHSHGVGDDFIRNTAQVISEIFAKQAYRIGGDEFVVIARETEKEEFLQKVQMMQECIETEKLNVSLGYQWEEKCDNLDTLLKEAEKMMYQKKELYYQTHSRHRRTE